MNTVIQIQDLNKPADVQKVLQEIAIEIVIRALRDGKV